jgi:hypothetical protein
MRQSCTEALVTEEPDDRIGHVRICGGSGWATAASTRIAPSEARGVGIGRNLMKFAIVTQWVRAEFGSSPT